MTDDERKKKRRRRRRKRRRKKKSNKDRKRRRVKPPERRDNVDKMLDDIREDDGTALIDGEELWENYGCGLTSSDLLKEFVGPLLAGLQPSDGRSAVNKTLMTGMGVWNELVGADSVEAAKASFLERYEGAVEDIEETLGPVFDMLAERKHELFPDDARLFRDFEVTETRAGFQIDVAAVPPEDVARDILGN